MRHQRLDKPPPFRPRASASGKMRRDFTDVAGVLKILAHELLNRQPADHRRILPQVRDAQLIGAFEDVFSLAVLKMQVIANPEQEVTRCTQFSLFLLREPAGLSKRVEVAFAITNEADPADQLQV